MNVVEGFRLHPMAANASYTLSAPHLGGFLATVAGTLTITNPTGTVLVNAVPVTAGIYTPLPSHFNENGVVVSLAGGAAGTLFI